MSRIVVILVVSLVLAGWLIVSTMDLAMAANDERFYCKQVAIHIETNGAAGWPAYRGVEQCQ